MNTLDIHNYNNGQTDFVLERKLISIHSEDRDIIKWPNSNHFEVQLPDDYHNIHSMRLVDVTIPVNYYTFCKEYQNTKLKFSVTTEIDSEMVETNMEIEIQEGFYEPNDLARELTNKMNQAIVDDSTINYPEYIGFNVFHDRVSQKFWFGNSRHDFKLLFDEHIIYPDTSTTCNQPILWNNYSKWGLPYYLGFKKEVYNTTSTSNSVTFDYMDEDETLWLSPDESNSSTTCYYIEAPSIINIMGEKTIYMELEKYNSYDELEPFSQATNNFRTTAHEMTSPITVKSHYSRTARKETTQNDFGGKVNAAFAKIPVSIIPHGETFDSRNGFLQNITIFEPPLERIKKMKFKFRYHDGRLVKFDNNAINFTIELHKLKNEITERKKVRVPPLYTL